MRLKVLTNLAKASIILLLSTTTHGNSNANTQVGLIKTFDIEIRRLEFPQSFKDLKCSKEIIDHAKKLNVDTSKISYQSARISQLNSELDKIGAQMFPKTFRANEVEKRIRQLQNDLILKTVEQRGAIHNEIASLNRQLDTIKQSQAFNREKLKLFDLDVSVVIPILYGDFNKTWDLKDLNFLSRSDFSREVSNLIQSYERTHHRGRPVVKIACSNEENFACRAIETGIENSIGDSNNKIQFQASLLTDAAITSYSFFNKELDSLVVVNLNRNCEIQELVSQKRINAKVCGVVLSDFRVVDRKKGTTSADPDLVTECMVLAPLLGITPPSSVPNPAPRPDRGAPRFTR